MPVRKPQLELNMEQQTGSKLGKENVKAAYCHPAYLTYMQSAAAAAKSLQSCLIIWTIACLAPLSVAFSRQEYWSGLPFLPPGDLPDPGIDLYI